MAKYVMMLLLWLGGCETDVNLFLKKDHTIDYQTEQAPVLDTATGICYESELLKRMDSVDLGPQALQYLYVKGTDDRLAIAANDVDQNKLGDCYFMAVLAALADQQPERIKEHISGPFEDNTYRVCFYERGEAIEVVVQADFPTLLDTLYKDGNPYIKKIYPYAGAGDDEFWVMLMEKAFAKYIGGYKHINRGRSEHAIKILTGLDAGWVPVGLYTESTLLNLIATVIENHQPIVASTKRGQEHFAFIDSKTGKTVNIYKNHVYQIVDVRLKSKIITLRNPHNTNDDETIGGSLLRLSSQQFEQYFSRVTMPNQLIVKLPAESWHFHSESLKNMQSFLINNLLH